MSNHPNWYQFQESICKHFISLGADAKTNARVQGVRTKHDIDVYVKTKFLGVDITWLVEAKLWNKRVSKSHVLAFRTIVDDLGADRGFLVSSKGFQSGAIEAAKNTNIELKTYDSLISDTKEAIESEILKTYKKRLQLIEDRYWAHSKAIRIKYGLRHEVTDYSMSFIGQQLLTTARTAIREAEERKYPIDLETFLKEHQGNKLANNFQQLSNWLNLNLNYFEEKLLKAEWEMHKNGEYNPNPDLTPDGELTTTEMMVDMLYKIKKDG